MSTIKIRNLPLATNEQVKPGNFLACALDTDSGLQKLTRKLTLSQVVSGGLQDGAVPIPITSLPIATNNSLGVVQIGANLNITPEGILSADNSTTPYQLPTASETVLGGIKVGDNLTIDPDGTLNAPTPSGGGGSGSGTPNWSSGWVNTDSTTSVANGATLNFTHNLGSADLIFTLYAADDNSGTNTVAIGVGSDLGSSGVTMAGAQIQSVSSTQVTLQLGSSGYNTLNSTGQRVNGSETNYTGKFIKIVASAGGSGGGTFYAFTSGIITNEGQHTITYPAGWTSGIPDNIIVSTQYPTGDASSTVHFQLVSFTASAVTVFAQAGAATFATHFCDVLLVKN